MICCRNGVLPNLRFLWNKRAEISRDGPHVAVRQLIPGFGEGIRELLRMIEEALGDRRVVRVHLQGEIRCEHSRSAPLRRIVGARDADRWMPVLLWSPLVRAGWAL